jgi:hypothetical protein
MMAVLEELLRGRSSRRTRAEQDTGKRVVLFLLIRWMDPSSALQQRNTMADKNSGHRGV